MWLKDLLIAYSCWLAEINTKGFECPVGNILKVQKKYLSTVHFHDYRISFHSKRYNETHLNKIGCVYFWYHFKQQLGFEWLDRKDWLVLMILVGFKYTVKLILGKPLFHLFFSLLFSLNIFTLVLFKYAVIWILWFGFFLSPKGCCHRPWPPTSFFLFFAVRFLFSLCLDM